ncbi:MAG: AMP-binding protein [Exilispira sp.]|nr:AMP-binding protein [Exilispira sp.]
MRTKFDYSSTKNTFTLAQMVGDFKTREPDLPAIKYKTDNGELLLSYKQLQRRIYALASYFVSIGLKRGDKLALLSDNRLEWLLVDLACQVLGIIDVPRGANISEDEMKYILNHAEVTATICETPGVLRRLINISNQILPQKIVVLIEGEIEEAEIPFVYFSEANEKGLLLLSNYENQIEESIKESKPEDVVTIIYTSGTTGIPKGVMLTNGSICSNVTGMPEMAQIVAKDKFLAILPAWHAFERTVEYTVLNVRGFIIYSKPIPSILLRDLSIENPQYVVSVPRVWEGIYDGLLRTLKNSGKVKYQLFLFFQSVARFWFKKKIAIHEQIPFFSKDEYFKNLVMIPWNFLCYLFSYPLFLLGTALIFSKVKAKLGTGFKCGISGGGALPKHIDEFFNAIGIKLLEGYGLTETSPVVCVRRYLKPTIYTIGDWVPKTEIEIRDENGNKLGYGKKGIIHIKGPQLMKGYYKMEEQTNKVLKDGWFNTGDIGRMDIRGYVQITGRAKDTIVLLGGENIEPEPIEKKLMESQYIKTAVVVGQDKRMLGVLIVPDLENFNMLFKEREGMKFETLKDLIEYENTKIIIQKEIQRLISYSNGFKRYELIGAFYLLPNEFVTGIELTETLKVRRNVVYEKYSKEIESLFAK